MNRFSVIVVLLFASRVSFCQSEKDRLLAYQSILDNYTKTDTIIEKNREIYNKTIWQLPFWGLHEASVSLDNRVFPNSFLYSQQLIQSVNLADYDISDALIYIENKSIDKKCVMINEAHHLSMHRLFTTQLLEKLRRHGYNYLACEGLSLSDAYINTRGFPLKTSGYYISDPFYANMIKKAIELGYTIVAYDGYGGSDGMEGREKFQAKNIAAIFEKDASAKVLVHAGLGHIREDTTMLKTMAFWFKKYSGIDPFTINQYSMSPQSASMFEHEKYTLISNRITAPSVLINRLSDTIAIDSRMDATVFHPKVEYDSNGEPSWLRNCPSYYRMEFDVKENTSRKILFFDLLKESESAYSDAVPIYTHVVKNDVCKKIKVYSPFTGRHILKMYYDDGSCDKEIIVLK